MCFKGTPALTEVSNHTYSQSCTTVSTISGDSLEHIFTHFFLILSPPFKGANAVLRTQHETSKHGGTRRTSGQAVSHVSPLTYEASETEVLRRNVPVRPELCSERPHILNPPLTSLVTKYISYPRLVLNTTDVVFVFFLVSLLFPFIIKYYFLISPNHQMHKTSFFFSSSNRIKYKHMCILVVVSRIWTYKSKAC